MAREGQRMRGFEWGRRFVRQKIEASVDSLSSLRHALGVGLSAAVYGASEGLRTVLVER